MTLWRGEEDCQHTTHQPEIKVTPKKEIAGKKNPPHSILPLFEESESELWFVKADTSLHEKGITNKNAMYDYVVQSLAIEELWKIKEVLKNPLTTVRYTTIKAILIRLTGISHCYQVNDCSNKILLIKGSTHFLRHRIRIIVGM